ncbi:FtsX-like permease family protein [Demequina iriomotensis]|uniref:FtsX-like permease family protein n=1 Tax=Demequina iriomotensis TaxID=1536641 RepID=UPI000A9EF815|nr:FtsX-like permease family protein [Demequina iriomotensis]
MRGNSSIQIALMREQWRAQRRYTITAGVLVALATALAAFATTSWGTRAATDAQIAATDGWTGDNVAVVGVWTDGIGMIDGEEIELTAVDDADRLAHIVQEASRDGVEVSRIASVHVELAEDADGGLTIVRAASSATLDDAIYRGFLPEAGEIALMTTYATELGVGIGDTVTALSVPREGVSEAEPVSLKVSGLTRSAPDDGVAIAPAGIVTEADLVTLAALGGLMPASNAEGGRTGYYDVALTWDGPPLPALEERMLFTAAEGGSAWTTFATMPEQAALLGAGTLAMVAVAVALAAGRAQGDVRTRWVATARALGATRRDVVLAGLTEGAVAGVAAGVMGLSVGWGVEAVIYGAYRAQSPDAYGPLVAVIPLGYAVALLASAVAVSAAIALVPALCAARVTPSAALAPQPPRANEARTPRVQGVVGVLLAALAVTRLDAAASSRSWGTWWSHGVLPAALVVLAALTLVGLVAITRTALMRLGAALGRSNRPSFVLAGHGLGTSPMGAAAAIAGTVTAFPGAVLVLGIASHALAWSSAFTDVLTVCGGVAAIAVTAGAIVGLAAWTTRAGALTEAATTGALGLDRHGRQIVAIARTAAPMLIGSLLGLAAGLVYGAFRLEPGAASVALALGLTVVGALGLLACCAAGAGIASLLAARGVDARSPQEAARLAR